MDNVCNRRLFSISFKVEMAEEQEYLWFSCKESKQNIEWILDKTLASRG